MCRLFPNLRVEVANIGQALAAQGVSGTISGFDGNPKFYREWIRSIEKYSLQVGAPDNRKKMIAYNKVLVQFWASFKDTWLQILIILGIK